MLNACRLVGAIVLLGAATSTANLPLALVLTASGLGLGATLPPD